MNNPQVVHRAIGFEFIPSFIYRYNMSVGNTSGTPDTDRSVYFI